MAQLYLPGVEAHARPGPYQALIDAAKGRHAEYSKIWDLFAFQDFTIHMGRFTHGVLREPASISPGLRELIAADPGGTDDGAIQSHAIDAVADIAVECHAQE